jgi:O-antigen/teichoic acid export membrane protein
MRSKRLTLNIRREQLIIPPREVTQRTSILLSLPPEKEQYDTYVGRIARGASISSFGTTVDQALRFAIQLSLARMYGPTQLGLYVLGATVFTVATNLAQFGMDQSVVRFVAEYRAKNDAARVRGTILLSLGATLALGLMLALLMFLGSGLLANSVFDKRSLEGVLRLFSGAVPFAALMGTALVATQGLQTMKPTSYVQQISRPLINFVLIVVFFLLETQILGAVVATVLSMVAGCVLAFYYLRRMFPKLLGGDTEPVFEGRELFSVSVPMGMVNLTRYVNAWGAVAVIGILGTAKEVGVYNVAARTGFLSAMVLVGFSGIFNPVISSLYSRGLLRDLGSLYQDVCRWTFMGSFLLFLPTVVLGKDIMVVFGQAFISGWPVMILISSAQLFSCSVGPTNRVLAMTGNQKVFLLAILGSTVVSLAGSVALVPLYGAMGAAAATTAGVVLFNVASVGFVHRLLGVWPYTRQYLKPLAAGVLAGTLLLMKLVVPLPEGFWTIVTLGPLFLLGFAALMLVFGLEVSDRQFVRSVWSAVAGNIAPRPRT